jgi:hypothetical protein
MRFNQLEGAGRLRKATYRNPPMLSILITLLVVAVLGYSLRSGRSGDLIVHRPYNNRYSDASGSREDHLG